jgi:aminoglycoside phosphotransferase (APT) family kinase protein
VAYPDAEVLDWASAALDTEVTVLRGLRHGGSPWLLRAGDREVVLRIARAGQAAETATEVAAMTHAARVAGAILPVAELLGYDLAERTGYGLVLTACMPGTSVIPPEADPERLQALGAAAARISSIELTPAPALPVRSRPIEPEDFAGMRREQGAPDLLRAAEAAVAATRPDDGRPGLVHGDLWHGNTLWDDGRLTAVLDWDCAGVGPAGIDLGSLRCDAASHPARLAGRDGQARERRPLLGRRRSPRLPAGHGLVPDIDGPSGPPRPDPRGHAQAPRRLPRRRAQPASSRLAVPPRPSPVAQVAGRPDSHIHGLPH